MPFKSDQFGKIVDEIAAKTGVRVLAVPDPAVTSTPVFVSSTRFGVEGPCSSIRCSSQLGSHGYGADATEFLEVFISMKTA